MAAKKAVFELRCYDVQPQHLAAFMTACTQHYSLRTNHSPLCGFWLTEVGGQNQVTHLWQYSSMSHRNLVRAALKGDAAWQTMYLRPTRHMLDKQTNSLMVPLDAAAVSMDNATPPTEPESEEMQRYRKESEDYVPPRKKEDVLYLLDYAHENPATATADVGVPEGVELLGTWQEVIGPQTSQIVRLLATKDADALLEARLALERRKAQGSALTQSKVLVSTPFAERIGAKWF